MLNHLGAVAAVKLSSAVPMAPCTGFDPCVTPNQDAPWLAPLRTIAGAILVTALIVLVITGVIGAVLMIAGKLGEMASARTVGFMIIIWVLIGAAIVGSISGLVLWATTFKLA